MSGDQSRMLLSESEDKVKGCRVGRLEGGLRPQWLGIGRKTPPNLGSSKRKNSGISKIGRAEARKGNEE